MNKLKKFIRKYFSSFAFFYQYLGKRIFIAIILSILVSVLDGFGLSMFLPLLQIVGGGGGVVEPDSMGKLQFLVNGMQAMGFSLTLGFVLLFMLFFFFLKGIASYCSFVYVVILQQSFIRKMRHRLLKGLNQLRFKKFITSDAGRVQNTMYAEVNGVAKAYSSYFSAFQQGVMVAVYMGFAFFVNSQFAILVSVGGIITNILYKIIYNQTKKASRNLTMSNHIYAGQIVQHIAHFKYLRATGMTEKYANRLRVTIDGIEEHRKKIGILSSIARAAREPLLISVVACIILLQTRYLGGTMGGILISLLFFYRALTALVAMQQYWGTFLSVAGSMENMKSFQQEVESNKETNGTTVFRHFEKAISFKEVDFSYGKSKILKNINLTINKNESIAFVGESGSGKTTIVNLIAGLLPPDNGQTMVDGFQFRDLNKTTYQKRVGYITQDPVIFNDTIFNNVTFWSEPTQENILRFETAVRQASLTTFLDTLSDGKETRLGNNGLNLSGGQKQRISIARELFKDIDILIMDEATSSLDSGTEFAIQQSIDALQGSYTLVIVAHRLSTIHNVDRVIFMEDGKIENEGSFFELVEKLPQFKKMVELQEL